MYPCGLTETRCLWPGISLGISVTQPAPPPCAPSDRPCTPHSARRGRTGPSARRRCRRQPRPCDHRRRSSPRPSFRSFRRTRPATRPRRRKRTSQGRARYPPPPPPNDRGNGSGPPWTGGFGSLIYGEGTAIVVVIFYRRRQRRGRWRCIFLDRRKRRRHDALDHARHPHGPPGGIDPLHCHDLAREEGASILAVTAVAHVATVVPEQAREVERDRRYHGMPARSLELHRRLVEPAVPRGPLRISCRRRAPGSASAGPRAPTWRIPRRQRRCPSRPYGLVVRRPLLPLHLVLDDPVHLGGDLRVPRPRPMIPYA